MAAGGSGRRAGDGDRLPGRSRGKRRRLIRPPGANGAKPPAGRGGPAGGARRGAVPRRLRRHRRLAGPVRSGGRAHGGWRL